MGEAAGGVSRVDVEDDVERLLSEGVVEGSRQRREGLCVDDEALFEGSLAVNSASITVKAVALVQKD